MRYFIDFEASSLSKKSYPIELGWVDETGEGEGLLIRPAPGWTEWDEGAAAVHGISREELFRDGAPHDEVCARLIEFAEGGDGNVLYASAPSWDGHWLSMLLRASGQPRHRIRLRDSDEAFLEAVGANDTLSEDEAKARIAQVRAAIVQGPPAHRAKADARREWLIWRSLVDGELKSRR
jgi:hypothetical protein